MSTSLNYEVIPNRNLKLENLVRLARKAMDHSFTEFRMNVSLFYLDISCILEMGPSCTHAKYRATKRSVVLDGLAEAMVCIDYDDADVDIRQNSEYERFVFSSISRSMCLMSESEIFDRLLSQNLGWVTASKRKTGYINMMTAIQQLVDVNGLLP